MRDIDVQHRAGIVVLVAADLRPGALVESRARQYACGPRRRRGRATPSMPVPEAGGLHEGR